MKKLLRKLTFTPSTEDISDGKVSHSQILPQNYPPPPKIYFSHVPKCAGSSVYLSLKKDIYTPHRLGEFDIKLQESKYAADILETSMMSVRETVLAYNLSIKSNFFGRGHCFCRPNLIRNFYHEWNFLTVLRDPIERWISLYVYNSFKESKWSKNTLPLNKYIQSNKGIVAGQTFLYYFSNLSLTRNPSPADYIEQALSNLQQFSIVGTTKHLHLLANQVSEDFKVNLNIPQINISPNSELAQQIKSETGTLKKIEKLCEYDIELYNRFLDNFGPIYSKKTQRNT
ncbi:hypothetical protein [Microbulbifer sp. DLAB2-AA]|uniref:hypothetical protein n=1 Tax=Microbulbifer sp. DLAB2-AA TaxID=3243394 RepID=UPI0040391FA6